MQKCILASATTLPRTKKTSSFSQLTSVKPPGQYWNETSKEAETRERPQQWQACQTWLLQEAFGMCEDILLNELNLFYGHFDLNKESSESTLPL